MKKNKHLSFIKKILHPFIMLVRNKQHDIHVKEEIRKLHAIPRTKEKKVFYLGVTEHTNLGDLAQFYCIKNWICNYLKEFHPYYIEASTIVHPKYKFIHYFKKLYNSQNDVIIFQSGYTTTDLGGYHDLMHRIIADNIPNAKILMMPQTIFFKSEKNRNRTSNSYNQCSRMLFLARDEVSYKMAQNMFPNLTIKCYPDIVTTLIGTLSFNNPRSKIMLCRRDDGEKFYSESELMELTNKLSKIAPVDISDTWSPVKFKETIKNLDFFIKKEIEKYSYYKVTITDRYHGTIFSLCAGTPVIIIKTNDHKVITGANWFKGIYDDYVYVAENLDDAYNKVQQIIEKRLNNKLPIHFGPHYYEEKLKELFYKI